MEFSLIETIYKLNLLEVSILFIVGFLIFYYSLYKGIYIIIFSLVLSASLVGSTIPIVDHIAALVRWLSIFLLLAIAIQHGRWRVSLGYMMFWGYVVIGFIFLLRVINPSWQLQKSILLLILAFAIPLAYSDEECGSLKRCIVLISVVAVIFSLLNFINLLGRFGETSRFSGFFKGAPTFSLALGGLLPFAFWGMWKADNKIIRLACGSGFLIGLVTLILSGQRTGTISGIFGIIPLLLTIRRRKFIRLSVLFIIIPIMSGYILLQHYNIGKMNFLFNRYSLKSNLSGRQAIWNDALSEIQKNPLLGRGIGASEMIMSYSFHNSYLEVLFNTGFFGLILFLISQGYFMYRTIYLWRISKDPEVMSVLALALGYMLGFIVVCIFESSGAEASNLNLILYLFLGAVVSNNHLANHTQFSSSGNAVLRYA